MQARQFFASAFVLAALAGCSASKESLTRPTPAPTSPPAVIEVPSDFPEVTEAPPEATTEPVSCAETTIKYVVAGMGFTFIPDGDTSQASYAVVLRNPSRACSTSLTNVSVDFTNKAGEVVDTEQVPLGPIPPGGTAAIADFAFVKERPAHMSFPSLQSDGQEPDVGALRVTNVHYIPGEFDARITGKVHSTLPSQTQAYVAVVIRRAGRIVGGGFTYVDVPHNGVAGFEVTSLSQFPRGDRYIAYAVSS